MLQRSLRLKEKVGKPIVWAPLPHQALYWELGTLWGLEVTEVELPFSAGFLGMDRQARICFYPFT